MKVVITGHTCGIGRSIDKLLAEKGYEVVGLSRSNGFDITNTEKIMKTIDRYDPDIFINNAYAPGSQTFLLKQVFSNWREREKLLINMCSVAALIPSDHVDYGMPYASDKREQKVFCDSHNFKYSKGDYTETKCRLVNLCFDYVKTSFKSKHDKRLYPNLEPNQVAGVVSYVIEGYNNNICFREVSFHSTKSPELMKEEV